MTNTKTSGLPGERVIKSSDQGVLELTNYRVKFDAEATGSSKHLSIPLDAVASCGLLTRSHPWLLIAAAIAGVLAFMQPQKEIRYLLLFVAIIFVVAYFITRSAVITISSSGGENIVVPASGMTSEQITPFLNAVLEAKLNYLGRRDAPNSLLELESEQAGLDVTPEAATGPKGKCPNCDSAIPITSITCPRCRADFSSASAWKVTPLEPT